ncbi:serine hydrolase [Pseudoalteromonas sp. MQS005]|uniref:serine hydrolase n=1 Tax=Pseudoalteromonas sp. MQS005 TaxID=1854052 RepID=UPI0007E5253F|nr:serine hydrolase [Pseudoalteromonas sp. MQS005]
MNSGRFILLWNPAVEWTGGGYASTSLDLALWGSILFNGKLLKEKYLNKLVDGTSIPSQKNLEYGLGVVIYQDKVLGKIYGHRGWIPGYTSSLKYYNNYGFTIAIQINTDTARLDDGSDAILLLESALSDFALERNNPNPLIELGKET